MSVDTKAARDQANDSDAFYLAETVIELADEVDRLREQHEDKNTWYREAKLWLERREKEIWLPLKAKHEALLEAAKAVDRQIAITMHVRLETSKAWRDAIADCGGDDG